MLEITRFPHQTLSSHDRKLAHALLKAYGATPWGSRIGVGQATHRTRRGYCDPPHPLDVRARLRRFARELMTSQGALGLLRLGEPIFFPQRLRLLRAAKRIERVGSDAGAVLSPCVVPARGRLLISRKRGLREVRVEL